MLRTKWNNNWLFSDKAPSMMDALQGGPRFSEVVLPHDAMIHESRRKDTKNGGQTGFYPGGNYIYKKEFMVPPEWKEGTAILEFEGVQETAMVYVNGDLAATHLNGYSGFKVCLDSFLNYGAENEVRVLANNAAEQNSRWYSGSGIYRDVNLLLGGKAVITADSVRIDTPEATAEGASVQIKADVQNLLKDKLKTQVRFTLMRDGKEIGQETVHVTLFSEDKDTVHASIYIDHPDLWSPEHPALYECTVEILDEKGSVIDTDLEHFGIRTLQLDAIHGLRINGEMVKLRGACIHHDNGIIGAATFAAAEDRRCRQMKEAGFNSIRSSHHPMSRAMLNACDKYGMLVMDEVGDMWTNHKNCNDYALHFKDHIDAEIEGIVAKDYNHPCVILYSTGNEIPEMGTERGAGINRCISDRFHDLDRSRFTTAAINSMLAAGDRMGTITSEVLAQMGIDMTQMAGGGNKESTNAGAAELNAMMAIMIGPIADAIAAHPKMSGILEESSEAMDVIGLNYATGRHELEHSLHPNKTVLGTETFPGDIVNLWKVVKNNAHVIGDFTWTGYDYLGEAGCGIYYYNGNMNFNGQWPDRAAYIGDIDLNGSRRPVSYLRETVFGIRKAPYIAVENVDHFGQQHSWTGWMLKKDLISSWTWPGQEGKPTTADIYSNSDEVELFLNDRSLGRKPAGEAHGFTASYDLTYEPGELTAVSYDATGKETGRYSLKTADTSISLSAICEENKLKANGQDLAFPVVQLTDVNGIVNMSSMAQKKIHVTVEGPGVLQGFGSADPSTEEGYTASECKSYEGRAMAAIRSTRQPGTIHVTFEAEGIEPVCVEIISE